jgi:hypothetical protein
MNGEAIKKKKERKRERAQVTRLQATGGSVHDVTAHGCDGSVYGLSRDFACECVYGTHHLFHMDVARLGRDVFSASFDTNDATCRRHGLYMTVNGHMQIGCWRRCLRRLCGGSSRWVGRIVDELTIHEDARTLHAARRSRPALRTHAYFRGRG